MSTNKPQRNIARVDYKIYNRTGIKLLKENRKGISTMATNIDTELKLVCRLDRFKSMSLVYSMKQKILKTELRNYVASYEELHIALKNELGSDSYAESYPDYEARIKSVTDWIRSAKFEIRNKKEKNPVEPRLKSEEQTEREKTKVITEEKYLREN